MEQSIKIDQWEELLRCYFNRELITFTSHEATVIILSKYLYSKLMNTTEDAACGRKVLTYSFAKIKITVRQPLFFISGLNNKGEEEIVWLIEDLSFAEQTELLDALFAVSINSPPIYKINN